MTMIKGETIDPLKELDSALEIISTELTAVLLNIKFGILAVEKFIPQLINGYKLALKNNLIEIENIIRLKKFII